MTRWYCRFCGIVRDITVSDPAKEMTPFCRHNDPTLPAGRMQRIKPGHPYAEGDLPWGESDPATTRKAS